MKRLLFALSTGLFVFFTLNSEESEHLKAQGLLRSCVNYPYDLGINLKQNPSGSFQLLSTSRVNMKIDNTSFISRALMEANLRAKLNISNFIKLTNNSKDKKISDIGFPIRIDGRVMRTNRQFKNKLRKNSFPTSSDLKGVKQLAICNSSSNFVIVTLEVTNSTIRASDYLKEAQ
tara:strand:+ start:168 stop:692 length:525 start_codon:yes stop_codon:yes gene_type:complete